MNIDPVDAGYTSSLFDQIKKLLEALKNLEAFVEEWSEENNNGLLVNEPPMVKARKVIQSIEGRKQP